MSFDVAAEAYDRFMGRYAVPLRRSFADFAGVAEGQRVLDVGCGPGALTSELVARVGAARVTAVDPSEGFVEAARDRLPGVRVEQALRRAPTVRRTDSFDAALAQLVVHFMSDPVAGLAEMARVTRRDGVVAACVWDLAGGRAPVSVYWDAARDLDHDVSDESGLAGAREGHLEELLAAAGLRELESAPLTVHVQYADFDEWWEPYTLGVGPAGQHAAGLDPESLTEMREACRRRLPGRSVRDRGARLGRPWSRLTIPGMAGTERRREHRLDER